MDKYPVDYAARLAKAIGGASRALANEDAEQGPAWRELLSAERAWPLAVLLAFWYLQPASRQSVYGPAIRTLAEDSRARMPAADFYGIWRSFDAYEALLSPPAQLAYEAKTPYEVAAAGGAFKYAAKKIGVALLSAALKSPLFLAASERLRQVIPAPGSESAAQKTKSPPSAQSALKTESEPGPRSAQKGGSQPSARSAQAASSQPGARSVQAASSRPSEVYPQAASSRQGERSAQAASSQPGERSAQAASSQPGARSTQAASSRPSEVSAQAASSRQGARSAQAMNSKPTEGTKRTAAVPAARASLAATPVLSEQDRCVLLLVSRGHSQKEAEQICQGPARQASRLPSSAKGKKA